MIKKRGVFYKLGLFFSRARASFLEGFYAVHVKVRYLHDRTYQKGPKWYRNWSDKQYSESIHKAAFIAFIFSYLVFYSLQYLAPLLMNPLKPGEAFAGTNSKSWTTRGDFNTNTTKVGSLVISGVQDQDDANLSLTSEINQNVSPIAAGSNVNIGVKNDGTLVSAGASIGNAAPWSTVKSIDVHNNRIAALRIDGTVWGEGMSESTALLDWSDIKAISVGQNFIVGLKNDGTVVALGDNTYGQRNVSSWTGIKAISTGTLHTLGLKEDGTVVAVGYSTGGALEVTGWSGIKAIAGSQNSSYAVKNDGTVVRTASSQNTDSWTDIKAISASPTYHVIGLKNNGTVVGAGIDTHEECDEEDCWPEVDGRVSGVSSWNNIVAISAGATHSFGLKSDGTVVSVGWDVGQNNVSAWTDIKQPAYTYSSPASVSGLTHNTTSKSTYSSVKFALAQTLPANASVGISVRAADTSGALASATFYDLTNVTAISSADAACTAISASASRSCYSGTVVGAGGGALAGKFAEVKVVLQTSDGLGTPNLDGITLVYESLENPQNVVIKRSDGTTAVTGFTNETEIKVVSDNLTCSGCTGTLTGRKMQVQLKKTEAGTFDSPTTDEITNLVNGTSVDNGNGTYTSVAAISGLEAAKSYQIRYRATDDAGRVTDWVYFGSGINSAAEADFSVDQISPTVSSVSINSGAQYVNSNTVTLSINAADNGGSELGFMQFSNDNGTTWGALTDDNGAITNSVESCTAPKSWDGSTCWAVYGSTYSWKLASGDGEKKVVARVKDNAGNVSTSGNFTESFTATTYKDAINTTAEWSESGSIQLTKSSGSWSDVSNGLTGTSAAVKVKFINSSIGNTVNSSGIWHTTDGGASWARVNNGPGSAPFDMEFLDANIGWILYSDGFVYKTVNGGVTWAIFGSASFTTSHGLFFIDENNGWIVGHNGIATAYIRRTINGGSSWSAQTPGVTNYLRDVYFADANNGWIVGNSGTILRTTNGGTNWAPQTSNTTNHLYDVIFIDSNTGWAVGDSGTILKTVNGGTTWTAQTSGTTAGLKEITKINSSTLWVAGNSNTMLKTSNAGENWTSVNTGINSSLTGVSFVEPNLGWASGTVSFTPKVYAFSTPYNSPGVIQSLKINTSSENISKATLTKNDILNGQTINYYLSADGGSHWEGPITPGEEWTFSNTGNDLRWKAQLSTSNTSVTPSIQDVTVVYSINPTSSQTVILDSQAPTGSVQINSNAEFVNSVNVTLTPSASDGAGSGVAEMRFSNDGAVWSGWETYSADPKAWTLGTGDGEKTVYIQYKDAAGNFAGNIEWLQGRAGTAMEGKQLYFQQLPDAAWKKTDTACSGPQCSGGIETYPSYTGYTSLVADNSVNFSDYPARESCQLLPNGGGRLPTIAELKEIHTGNASYGGWVNFNNSIWSATGRLATSSHALNNYSNVLNGWKHAEYGVVCVRDGSNISGITRTITLDTTAPNGTISNLNANYKTSSISINYTASDAHSGVASTKLYYTRQTAAPYTWTAYPNNSTSTEFNSSPITFDTNLIADSNKEGNYGFRLVLQDNISNTTAVPGYSDAPPSGATTVIDTVAPTTNGTITGGSSGSNGWYTSDVTYTLTPADVTSGVTSTVYCVDTAGTCNPTTPYVSPFVISTESATNHVIYKSTDNAGNVQGVQDVVIKIDKTAPTTSSSINPNNPDGNNGFYINAPDITLTASDISGLTYYYKWDDPTVTNPSTGSTVAMPADGTHTLYFYSKDGAGNSEVTAIKSAGPYKLDLNGPAVSEFSITGAVPISGGRFAVSNNHLTLKIMASDSISDVDTFQISNEAPVYSMEPVTYSSLTNNNYNWDILTREDSALPQTVTLKIKDGAGKETIRSLEVVYDNTPPGSATIAPKSTNGGTDLLGVGQIDNPYWYSHSTPYFALSATDPNALPSGIKGYKYCFSTSVSCNPTTFISNNYYQPTIAGQGKYYLRVLSVDNVNLESGITTYNYNYDSSPPSSPMFGLSASTTVDGAVQLTWDPITISAQQAPVEKFIIERIKNTVYAGGYSPNGTWDSGNQVTNFNNGYAIFETTNPSSFTDNATNTPSGMPVLLGGVKYRYRIVYKDTSNSAYSPPPMSINDTALGYTRDHDDPTSPTNVRAFVCDGTNYCSNEQMDSGRTHKGHEIKVTWNPASDGDGSGIGGYLIYRKQGDSLDPNSWTLAGELLMPNTLEWYDNDYRVHQDNTIYPKTAGDKAAVLNDYTIYHYRVVAFDNATTEYLENGQPDRNSSGLFPSGTGEDMFTNLNIVLQNEPPVRTPDVTAPALPTGIVERRAGLDSTPGEIKHQQINIYWDSNYNLSTSDNDPEGAPVLKIYGYKGTAELANPLPDKALFADWTSQFTHPSNDPNPNSYMIQGLDDLTYYYFYIKVTDRWGNSDNNSTPVIDPPAKTGNSNAPGNITTATVDTFHNFSSTEIGDKAYLTFNGVLARGCQPDGTDCVVQYEIYLSETNNTASCELNDADKCWLQLNQPQKFTVDQPENNYNDQRSTYFNHTFTGLNDATDYYVRVRAKSNSVEEEIQHGPLYDPTLLFITPDATAPTIPATVGLNVKVKDTYPNSTILRNIVTWELPEIPTRNKLDNSCTAVVVNSQPLIKNNKQQCNDFAKYLIYRQEVNGSGEPVSNPVLVRTETNFNENFFIDSLDKITDLVLLNANLKYYVVVVDNADTTFRYPNGGSLVNKPTNGSAFANSSEKSWSLNDIIPNHTTPRLANLVTVPDDGRLGVSSAVIEWDTDQASDSLVEYREWGSSSSTPWVAVGSRDNVTHHSVRIFDLKTDTQYEYRVVSRNYLANDLMVHKDNYTQKLEENNLSNAAFPVLKTKKFKIEIPANPAEFMTKTTSTIQINWTTTKDAKTNYIEFFAKHDPDNPQLRGIAGQLATSSGYNLTSHDVVIKGLRPKTTYKFKIKSVSTDNYQSEYPEGVGQFLEFETNSYDTSQFTISPSSSNVAERNITSTTAQIVWSTANPTTSWVDYSTKSGLYDISSGNNDLNTQHAVVLNGLVPGTKYYYKVRGSDDYGNTYTSQEFTFTAVLKPKISNLKISDVTSYTVTISWETNIDTETVINWGKSTAYGEKKGIPERTKNHMIKVDNLEDNTEYHYQILARDDAGNEVADEDKVVRTPLDTVGPKIMDMKTDILPLNENENTASVIISWKTDKPATRQIQYDQGIVGGRYSKSSIEDISLSTNHTVIIKGLEPGTNYHYRIMTKDKRGNQTVSNDYSFITPTAEKSILQLILRSLEETFSWVKNIGSFFNNLGKKQE